ncbi:MAG: carboxypeptidase-like regulatory domain-containing protein [Polyangiales bacterium]
MTLRRRAIPASTTLALTTLLALGCNRRPSEPAARPPVTHDAGVTTPTSRDAEAVAPSGPTGSVEGVVRLTGPVPQPTPLNADVETMNRPGCRAAAYEYYARPFGVTEPGPLPEAIVTVDARAPGRPPPPRNRYANFHDCTIEPRILAMSLNDRLILHAETNQHHLPKVDGMGATIAQLLNRGEDQEPHVVRPGRYILHSVNFPNWMQTPLVVTPNWFYDQTNREGRFRVDHLPPGTYTMHAWFPGARAVDATVTITANGVAHQDFALTPLPPGEYRPPQPPADAGPIIP